MRYLRTVNGCNVFSFECPRCEAAGEIGIPVNQTLARHECGVLFKQLQPSRMTPELQAFVQDIIGDYHTMLAIAEGQE